jgi:lipopolysaccharide transport system ATP-binding protein
MNARLGFSIAAHLKPNVLIIDEVLSVGDMPFQERCLKRMQEFKRQGAAIVFVSHNLQAVAMLCKSSLFIRNQVVAVGETPQVIDAYIRHAQDAKGIQWDGDLVVTHTALESAVGRTDDVPPGTPMVLRIRFEARRKLPNITFAFRVHRATDLLTVYDGNFSCDELGVGEVGAGEHVSLEFHFKANLVRGVYHTECIGVETPTQTFLNPPLPLASFSVLESRTWSGVADLSVTVAAQSERLSAIGKVSLCR